MLLRHGVVKYSHFLILAVLGHHLMQEVFVYVVIEVLDCNLHLWWFANVVFVDLRVEKEEPRYSVILTPEGKSGS